MDFELSPQEQTFRRKVHKFLENEEITVKAKKEWDDGLPVGPYSRELWKKLGKKGWNCPHWPKEYGGLGLPHVYRYILEEEFSYFGIRNNRIGAALAGPIILRYGSEAQKKYFLPLIAKGEIELALGYTEPQAGSDLSAIEIKAEDQGDFYILNGQKLFNSACHYAEYHWLMARTETTIPPHKGLSFFIVDLKSPGITVQPLWALGGEKGCSLRTNEVFYDNVQVPKSAMVGEKNRGFYMLIEALASERTSPSAAYAQRLERFVKFLKKTGKDKDPIVRQKLAELEIDVEVLKLIGMKVCWMIEKEQVPSIEAALAKSFAWQFMEKLANLQVDALGPFGLLHRDSDWAVMDGEAERLYRDFVFERITRGTPEMMWNLVATRGLGLKRSK